MQVPFLPELEVMRVGDQARTSVLDQSAVLDDHPSLDLRTLSERTYSMLLNEILSGRLSPRVQIDIDRLAKTWRVSRTPIKESLSRLASEGLVEVVSRKGSFVAELEPQRILDLLDVRTMLEVGASGAIVAHADEESIGMLRGDIARMVELSGIEDERAKLLTFLALDQEFHCRLIAIAGNPELNRIYRQLRVHMQIGRAYYDATSLALEQTLGEHADIIQCLEARDVDSLKRALSSHVGRVHDFIETQVETRK